jgi:hypothetical protein
VIECNGLILKRKRSVAELFLERADSPEQLRATSPEIACNLLKKLAGSCRRCRIFLEQHESAAYGQKTSTFLLACVVSWRPEGAFA